MPYISYQKTVGSKLRKRYYKRQFNELRDDFNHWGRSTWFLETEDNGIIVRQLEKYENGPILKYDKDRLADEYGMLGDQELDLEEFDSLEIPKTEFIENWNKI